MKVTVTNNPVTVGSSATVVCIVEMDPRVQPSELSLLVVDAQLSRDGTAVTLTGPNVTDTTFTYTIQLDSFGRNDSGNYTCTASVRPRPTSENLNQSGEQSYSITIRAGNKLCVFNPRHHYRHIFLPIVIPGVAPPMNVQASQSSTTAAVNVSWSPPSHGAAAITGYRIFFDGGDNVLVPSVVAFVGLAINDDVVGQTVSIRSEANEILSELINVTITGEISNNQYMYVPLWFNIPRLICSYKPYGKRNKSSSRCDYSSFPSNFMLQRDWHCCWCDYCSSMSGWSGDHHCCGHINLFVEVSLI